MTTQELYTELAKRGHYPLMVLTVDDVIESYWDGEQPPTEDEARRACAYVARKWAYGDDFDHALSWARECVAGNKVGV